MPLAPSPARIALKRSPDWPRTCRGYPCTFVQAAEAPLEELPSLPEGVLHLERKLSKAIYGNVYLVDLADPGTPTDLSAVKRMPREQVLSTSCQVESASNELHAANVISKLGAPYVVDIIGTAQDYNFFYLVTEFCERGDLFTWLIRTGPVRHEPLLREIFWQLLTAVCSLHQAGIAHRDISLENILIHGDGSLRLCDFGQALLVHALNAGTEEAAVPHSELGLPGKPEYRAPEVEVVGAPYRAKVADAFSCGVVLLALATGMYPSDVATLALAQQPSKQHLSLGDKLKLYFEQDTVLASGLKDLLRALLSPDSTKRATIERAMHHPWLVGSGLHLGNGSGLGTCHAGDVKFECEDSESSDFGLEAVDECRDISL